MWAPVYRARHRVDAADVVVSLAVGGRVSSRFLIERTGHTQEHRLRMTIVCQTSPELRKHCARSRSTQPCPDISSNVKLMSTQNMLDSADDCYSTRKLYVGERHTDPASTKTYTASERCTDSHCAHEAARLQQRWDMAMRCSQRHSTCLTVIAATEASSSP